MARNAENNYLSKYYTNESIRKKIDRILHKINAVNATKGTDSTDQERADINAAISSYMGDIAKIDEEFYKELTPDI